MELLERPGGGKRKKCEGIGHTRMSEGLEDKLLVAFLRCQTNVHE